MNKREFDRELIQRLSALPKDERQKILGFYNELFCDRRDRGESEAEIIRSFGDTKEIAAHYCAEETNEVYGADKSTNSSAFIKVSEKTKSTVTRLFANKYFLIFYFSAFFITIPLTIAFLSIVFSLFVAVFAIFISFVACGVTFFIAGPTYIAYGIVSVGLNKPAGLALVGSGLALFALSFVFMLIVKVFNYIRIFIFVKNEKKPNAYKRAVGRGVFKGFVAPLVAAIVIIVVGGSVFTFGLYRADWNFRSLDTAIYAPISRPIGSQIDKININVKSRNIDIIASTEDFRVETNNYGGSNVEVAIENGELDIAESYKYQIFHDTFNVFSWVNYDKRCIRIYVPSDVAEISAQVVSGSINITGMSSVSININIASGNVSINDSNALNVNIASTSGNITIKDSVAANLKASATSGNINTYSLRTTGADLKVTSGNIHARIIGSRDDYDVKSSVSSGHNSVGNKDRVGDNKISIKATSGNIRLTFIEN